MVTFTYASNAGKAGAQGVLDLQLTFTLNPRRPLRSNAIMLNFILYI